MHSDWFNGIEILQGRWQNGGKVGYCYPSHERVKNELNPLNAKLYPICHLLTLLGAHHILHVSRIRVKERKIYIYIYVGEIS